jgi:hypothetical protein
MHVRNCEKLIFSAIKIKNKIHNDSKGLCERVRMCVCVIVCFIHSVCTATNVYCFTVKYDLVTLKGVQTQFS